MIPSAPLTAQANTIDTHTHSIVHSIDPRVQEVMDKLKAMKATIAKQRVAA